jgi:DNA-binding beta-propeller fold protein YncE
MWLLAESKGDATLQELNLTSGKIQTVVPESTAAHALAQSPSGVVAVGVATGFTGAVELHNGSSGALIATVAVGASVKGLAAGADGSTLYVLNGTGTSSSVTLVNLQTDTTSASVPVPLATVGIAVQPTGQDLYALTAGGTVDEVNVGNGSVVGRFSVGPGPLQLAISSSGSTLFVLKRAGSGTNVGVIRLATERQQRAIAAPADCIDIQLSANGRQLYDVVGTPTYGNVQVFPVNA